MSRRASRVDNNHAEIVHALRQMGASVQSLARVGDDCPDILVGFQGRNTLLEIKSAKGKPSAGQQAWAAAWNGQSAVVRSIAEALLVVMSGRIEDGARVR